MQIAFQSWFYSSPCEGHATCQESNNGICKNVTFLTHIFGIHSSTGSLAEVRQKSPQTATLASVEIDFQINSYFTQLNEGLLQNIGPLVEYQNNEKPLSIAFREIDEGLLEETLGEDDANEGN